MLDHIRGSLKRVRYLLETYPELRDSDKKLWIAYLNVFHNLKNRIYTSSDPYITFLTIVYDEDIPSQDSLGRARRKIQEKGELQGQVRKNRIVEEERVREWAVQ